MILSGLFNLLTNDPGVSALIVEDGVHFTLLSKAVPLIPAIVIQRIHSQGPSTLDGQADLEDALFEFDAYANDQLTANRVRDALEALLQDFDGTLNEGTELHVYQTISRDLKYEAGGTTGWIFRSALDVHCFFKEPS